MVSFRKSILALLVLAVFAGLAMAQVGGGGGSNTAPLSCTATVAVPPQLRAEGITELIGDIVLTCSGGTPVATNALIPTANITVSLQTQVTSRLLGTASVSGASEALLLIDEPGSGLSGVGPALPQVLCGSPSVGAGSGSACLMASNGSGEPVVCTSVSSTGTCAAFGATTYNVFQGVVSGNQVTFNGIPVLAPGTNGSRVYRITNVRANASGVSLSGGTGTTQLPAAISISGSTSLPINNPVQIAGFLQTGLTASVRNENNSTSSTPLSLQYLQCTSVKTSSGGPVAGATLRFQETFATSFKTRFAVTPSSTGFQFVANQNIPGTIYNSESGFISSVGPFGNGAQAGITDFGTRLRAVFNNIPTGVSIYVTTTNYQSGTTNTWSNNTTPVGNLGFVTNGNTTSSIAVLVQSETAPDFGNTVPVVNFTTTNGANVTLAPVSLSATSSGQSGEAVWEVVGANPNAIDTMDFGIYFLYTANPGASGGGIPSLGTGQVDMSFAPVSSSTSATSSPVPRFVDLGNFNKSIITISTCVTQLMLPFVTNENGFETGISIANTSTDPYGAATPQNGACVLNFFGDNTTLGKTVVAPCTTAGACTGTIQTATVYAQTLSAIIGGSCTGTNGTGNCFQGYMIATCNFQYAHGFVFISDAHATNLAMGYLALVINDRGAGGEQLEN